MANQAPSAKELDMTNEKLPMKLRELIELKEKLATPKSKKKGQKLVLANRPDDKGAEIPLRPVPQLKKLEHESEEKFLSRIDKVFVALVFFFSFCLFLNLDYFHT